MTSNVAVTRIINPCVLIEIDGNALLTDPYFTNRWFFPMREPIGLRPEALPPLRAILGGHGVHDHWQLKSLATFRHHATTEVVAPNRRMIRQAQRAGFERVRQMHWGDTHELTPNLNLTCLPGERVLAGRARTNNYLITSASTRIFVGTEACSLDPIAEAAQHHRADIAILPIDGLTFGRKQLVMDAPSAIEATRLLGARSLVPIHYSQRPVRGLIACPSGIDELIAELASETDIEVIAGATGERLEIPSTPSTAHGQARRSM